MSIPDEAVEAAVHAFMLETPCTYCDGQGYTGPEEHESHVDIFGAAIRKALAAALPHLETDTLRHAIARIRELEEFVKDSECTCLPYAKLYDGMCQRCIYLKGDGQTTRQEADHE